MTPLFNPGLTDQTWHYQYLKENILVIFPHHNHNSHGQNINADKSQLRWEEIAKVAGKEMGADQIALLILSQEN